MLQPVAAVLEIRGPPLPRGSVVVVPCGAAGIAALSRQERFALMLDRDAAPAAVR